MSLFTHPVVGLVNVYTIVCVPTPAVPGLNVPALTSVIPVPDQIPFIGLPLKLTGASSGQNPLFAPAATTGSGCTVNNMVSRVKQFPAPLDNTIANVPAVVGSNNPVAETLVPDHVPDTGAPFNCTFGASIQASRSGPALASTGSTTVTFRVSNVVQPLPLVTV